MNNDDLLNRYLDNELGIDELQTIKNEIEKDGMILARLKALRAVDNSLRQIKSENAPAGFTERVMKAIADSSIKVKSKVSYFFLSMISILAVGIISIFVLSVRILGIQEGGGESKPLPQYIKEYFGKNSGIWESILKNNTVMLIGSMAALLLLLSLYFTIEAHKNFKNRLNNIS